MPIQISQDILNTLQKKFPETNIQSIIDNLFFEILDTTFKNGSTTIKGVGKFHSFVTFSKRIGTNVVRFKFRPSTTLIKKIRQDPYLLKNLPIKSQEVFTKKNIKKLSDARIIKQKENNKKAMSESSKYGIKKQKEKEVYNHVVDVLNG